MNGESSGRRGRRRGGKGRMSVGNLFGDPFALATISIAIVRVDPFQDGQDDDANESASTACVGDCICGGYLCTSSVDPIRSFSKLHLVDDGLHVLLHYRRHHLRHWWVTDISCGGTSFSHLSI